MSEKGRLFPLKDILNHENLQKHFKDNCRQTGLMRLTLCIFLLPLIFSCDTREKPLNCHAARIENERQYEGIVVRKRIENENHRYRVLVIDRFNSDVYELYFGPNRHEDLYNFTATGDTLTKKTGSSMINISKKNGEKGNFFFHLGCPDSLLLPI